MRLTWRRLASRLCAGLFAAMMLGASVPLAEARGGNVFSTLVGTWFGSGSVTDRNGENEGIRCRVTYSPLGEGGLSQSLVCASAGFRFDVAATIYNRGGSISGQWQETSRGVGGAIRGSISGSQIITTVSGPNFAAALTISARGRTQYVAIRPNAGDIASVSITFHR